MALGPILIFDKSLLESLNPDEALWLDNFFLTNITPLFFVETLADLEKSVRKGRTPEEVVGNVAYKTPDMQSHINAHHISILAAEFAGQEVPIEGFIMRSGGSSSNLTASAALSISEARRKRLSTAGSGTNSWTLSDRSRKHGD